MSNVMEAVEQVYEALKPLTEVERARVRRAVDILLDGELDYQAGVSASVVEPPKAGRTPMGRNSRGCTRKDTEAMLGRVVQLLKSHPKGMTGFALWDELGVTKNHPLVQSIRNAMNRRGIAKCSTKYRDGVWTLVIK